MDAARAHMSSPMPSIRGMFRSALVVFGVAATVASPAPARSSAAAGTHGAPLRASANRASTRNSDGETSRAGLEADLRSVVADVLGVDTAELVPEASLVDDLAADSLDLLEVAVVVESAFGVALGSRQMADVRNYRDLVDIVATSGRPPMPERELTPGLSAKTRVMRPGRGDAALERAEVLTLYAIDLIRDDALRGGPGTQLEVMLSVDARTVDVLGVRDAFARLERHRIGVSVRRDVPTEPMIGARRA